MFNYQLIFAINVAMAIGSCCVIVNRVGQSSSASWPRFDVIVSIWLGISVGAQVDIHVGLSELGILAGLELDVRSSPRARRHQRHDR